MFCNWSLLCYRLVVAWLDIQQLGRATFFVINVVWYIKHGKIASRVASNIEKAEVCEYKGKLSSASIDSFNCDNEGGPSKGSQHLLK